MSFIWSCKEQKMIIYCTVHENDENLTPPIFQWSLNQTSINQSEPRVYGRSIVNRHMVNIWQEILRSTISPAKSLTAHWILVLCIHLIIFCFSWSFFYCTRKWLCLRHFTLEPCHEKTCLMPYTDNKGTDQHAHPRSLISTFGFRCWDSIIPILAKSEISRL